MFERKFIWIATPILMRGRQIVAHSIKELVSLGFDSGAVVNCAKGRRFMHKNHIIKQAPQTISRRQLEKLCGEEVLRALELGLRPDPHSQMKQPIAAYNSATGEVTIFYSSNGLMAAGFNPDNVRAVIRGTRTHHRNHKFYRVDPEVWNCKGFGDE